MFNIVRNGDTTILSVWENLDIGSQAAFDGVLQAVTAGARGRIIVSLERCYYCDSKGLGVLLRHSRRLGPRLTVVVPPDNASRRIFEVCRIPELMSVRASLREALAERPRAGNASLSLRVPSRRIMRRERGVRTH